LIWSSALGLSLVWATEYCQLRPSSENISTKKYQLSKDTEYDVEATGELRSRHFSFAWEKILHHIRFGANSLDRNTAGGKRRNCRTN
jgi:hypothetical protein